jgi:hypothetical protein
MNTSKSVSMWAHLVRVDKTLWTRYPRLKRVVVVLGWAAAAWWAALALAVAAIFLTPYKLHGVLAIGVLTNPVRLLTATLSPVAPVKPEVK